MPRYGVSINNAQIAKLYVTQELTCADLAKKYGCTAATIRNRLISFGVKLRRSGKWKFKYLKYPFTGSLCEKAYMIGFRIGDLSVYKRNATSRAIIVRCHTTQQDQIDVIKNVFGKYGHVNISPPKVYGSHINCYLDLSFDFLMDKSIVPQEIKNDTKASWAFIAGYTDAEGNLIMNQGRARFKIDSYDKFVLDWIAEFLTKQGIRSKLRRIAEKGTKYPFEAKGVWPSDLWRLNINWAHDLQVFLEKAMVYLQHKKRISDARKCLDNIQERGFYE
jgi:hypothetical protein